MAAAAVVLNYTVNNDGPLSNVVDSSGEVVGRFFKCGDSYQARHNCRHEGAILGSEAAAIEYIVGIDLVIEARFSEQVQLAA